MRYAYPPYRSTAKYASIVGWISGAHPPLKSITIILHGAKNPLCHSARSEAQLQNLLNNRQNIFLVNQEDSATARRMTVFFFDKMVDALRLSTLHYYQTFSADALRLSTLHYWIPAFAGMTEQVGMTPPVIPCLTRHPAR